MLPLLVTGALVLCLTTKATMAYQAAHDAEPALHQAMEKGTEAMKAGSPQEAAVEFAAVTHLAPHFAEGYLNLGLALEQADQLDSARAALEKALQLKPELRGANLFLGIIAYRQDRYKDAEVSLLRETRIDPGDAKAFMWLGVCYLAENNPKAAIAPLDKAYSLDPKDQDILYHLGHAYLLMANASYAEMFQLNQDSMRVHQVLGEAYAKGFRTEQAIWEFELAVKMAPHQPGLHEELADQYWIAGQMDKAVAAYRQELAIDPYSTTSMYKLGSLLVLKQNPAEGVALLNRALRADPTLNDAHYYLGTGLMDLNRSQEAIQQFRLAIAADPENGRAMTSYYKLARLYRTLGDTRQAQDAMQNFLQMKSHIAEQQDRHTAQLVRDRASLPVDDAEKLDTSQDQ